MTVEPEIRVLISREEIAAAVSRLAGEITRDYHDKHPLVVGILKGSFIFLADLTRRLDFPLEIDFVQASSYGRGAAESSGELKLLLPLRTPPRGRHVILIEDIIDTGLTTASILDYIRAEAPASLKLCSLTDKPSRRTTPVVIDYLGMSVPDKFLVGYGFDWDERYRNLADICYVELPGA